MSKKNKTNSGHACGWLGTFLATHKLVFNFISLCSKTSGSATTKG